MCTKNLLMSGAGLLLVGVLGVVLQAGFEPAAMAVVADDEAALVHGGAYTCRPHQYANNNGCIGRTKGMGRCPGGPLYIQVPQNEPHIRGYPTIHTNCCRECGTNCGYWHVWHPCNT